MAELKENIDLITSFFNSAKGLLKPHSGEIHVTHKTVEPFSWWNIVDVATQTCGLHYHGQVVFDRYLYPSYINKKVLEDRSFTFFDARVIFLIVILFLLFSYIILDFYLHSRTVC